MIGQIVQRTVLGLTLGSIPGVFAPQEQPAKKPPVPSSKSPSGAELYTQHCGSCHGIDLRGNGPLPGASQVPPDLTTLTRRHGDRFPNAYVVSVLRYGVNMVAHGPAEMPVWGTEFAVNERLDAAQVASRIKNLTNYIKSFQRK